MRSKCIWCGDEKYHVWRPLPGFHGKSISFLSLTGVGSLFLKSLVTNAPMFSSSPRNVERVSYDKGCKSLDLYKDRLCLSQSNKTQRV